MVKRTGDMHGWVSGGRRIPKTPTGNLVMPVNKRPGHMDTEAYNDSMSGFMRYMYTGRFRKPENRQTGRNDMQ